MISSPPQGSAMNSSLLSPAVILAILRDKNHKASPLNSNTIFSPKIAKIIQDATQNDDAHSQNTKDSSPKENTDLENSPILFGEGQPGGMPRDMDDSMHKQEKSPLFSALKASPLLTTSVKGTPQSLPIHISGKPNVREVKTAIRRSSMREVRRDQSEDPRPDTHYSLLEPRKNKKVTFLLDDCSPVPSPVIVLTPGQKSRMMMKKNEARKLSLLTQEKSSPITNLRNIQFKPKSPGLATKLLPEQSSPALRNANFLRIKIKNKTLPPKGPNVERTDAPPSRESIADITLKVKQKDPPRERSSEGIRRSSFFKLPAISSAVTTKLNCDLATFSTAGKVSSSLIKGQETVGNILAFISPTNNSGLFKNENPGQNISVKKSRRKENISNNDDEKARSFFLS